MTEIFEKTKPAQGPDKCLRGNFLMSLAFELWAEAHSVDPHIWFDVKLWVDGPMEHAASWIDWIKSKLESYLISKQLQQSYSSSNYGIRSGHKIGQIAETQQIHKP